MTTTLNGEVSITTTWAGCEGLPTDGVGIFIRPTCYVLSSRIVDFEELYNAPNSPEYLVLGT
jgi:hypothetical protein